MTAIIILLIVASIAAAPATKPATRPTQSEALRLRDDAPEQLKLLASAADKRRPLVMKDALAQLKKANAYLSARKRGRVIRGAADQTMVSGNGEESFIYKSTDSKEMYVAEAQAAVDRARRRLDWVKIAPFFIPSTDDVGERIEAAWIGRIGSAQVLQVIDPQTVILTLRNLKWSQFKGGTADVWVTGIDTTGMTDETTNVFANTSGPVIMISGTTTYDTAIASNRTILKAATFDVDQYIVRE